jgi:signal-transduction protein with cAMP-binding, CBS, and nucleotidyltransferase domain
MPERLSEVMTRDPVTVPATASLEEAARLMRDNDIGDVLVVDNTGSLYGILTDRDIVVEGIAGGRPRPQRVWTKCVRMIRCRWVRTTPSPRQPS